MILLRIFCLVAVVGSEIVAITTQTPILACRGDRSFCSVHQDELNCGQRKIKLKQNFLTLGSEDMPRNSSIVADVDEIGSDGREQFGKCLFSSKLFKNHRNHFYCHFQAKIDEPQPELNNGQFVSEPCRCLCIVPYLENQSSTCFKGISSLAVTPVVVRKEIEVSFTLVDKKLSKCNFYFELHNFHKDPSNCQKNNEIHSETPEIKQHNQSSEEPVSCKFENVAVSSYYCILIYSHLASDECSECKWTTNVINFSLTDHPPVDSLQIKENDDVKPIIFTSVILSVLFGALLCIFYVRRKWRSSERYIEPSNHNDVQITIPNQSSTSQALEELTVLIIYNHEFKQHTKVVPALAEFLRKNCKCKVTYDQLEPQLFEDRFNWMKKKTEESDKIIVINSEGAYYAVDNIKEKKQLNISDDSIYSTLFGLWMAYLNDQPEFKSDYSKFINIRFSYTNEAFNIDVVSAHSVYEIPKYLREFCCCLHGLNPAIVDRFDKNLWWSPEDSSYCNLVKAIEDVHHFLRKNPNYISNKYLREEVSQHIC